MIMILSICRSLVKLPLLFLEKKFTKNLHTNVSTLTKRTTWVAKSASKVFFEKVNVSPLSTINKWSKQRQKYDHDVITQVDSMFLRTTFVFVLCLWICSLTWQSSDPKPKKDCFIIITLYPSINATCEVEIRRKWEINWLMHFEEGYKSWKRKHGSRIVAYIIIFDKIWNMYYLYCWLGSTTHVASILFACIWWGY